VPTDNSAVEAFLDRFHRLSTDDQLSAYIKIGQYLSADGAEAEPDSQLRVRQAGLEAMRRVASELGVEPGRLTLPRFDGARGRLGIELSGREIADAWGGWRIARATLVSGHGRETAQQQALRQAYRRGYPTHESYLDGIRLWLASDPPSRTLVAYERWGRAQNAQLPPDALPFASHQVIRNNLGLKWAEVIRVATGEIELAKASRPRPKRRPFENRGARHDLVNRSEVVKMLRVSPGRASRLFDKSTFPTPVLVIGTVRHWYREDVVAYKRRLPFPRRQPNELAGDYVGTREIAKMAGCSLAAVKIGADNPRGWVPSPKLVGTIAVFDRHEVEAAVAAHRASGRRRSAKPSG
jgi:hypothetical protein